MRQLGKWWLTRIFDPVDLGKEAAYERFCFFGGVTVEENLSQEQMQDLWNEEATKLDAGEEPAVEREAAAPSAEEAAPQGGETEELETQEASADTEEPATTDPLAKLPEEVKAAFGKISQLEQANAQLLQHVKTAEGRVAAMQREFAQAKAAQQSVVPQEAPTQGQMSAAAKNPEKWEQLKQDFPEWADAMEEYVAAKLGGVKPAAPGLDPQVVAAFVHQQVSQSKAEMARTIEEARIEGKYDGWKDTVNSTDFVQWFTVQTPEVQALANSPAARDAIRMLDLFNESKKRSATDIKQERGARLAAAATVRPGQTPPPKTLDDMSPSELWNYEAAQREKTRAQRGF
jgi:hypothetical protein